MPRPVLAITIIVLVTFTRLGAQTTSTEVLGTATDPGRTAFPLRVSQSGRTFVGRDGAPFLFVADTAWALTFRLNREEALRYLDVRKAQGFTVVQTRVLPSRGPGGPGAVDKNRYGQAPFKNDHDLGLPNDAYFDHVEWIVEQAAARGLLVSLAPAWLGCCGDGWYEILERNGAKGAQEFGQYLGRRFRRHDNVVWQHGGDRDPMAAWREVRALALAIKEAVPHHLHTIQFGASSRHIRPVFLGDYSWTDFDTIHTFEDVAAPLRANFFRDPPRPFVLGRSFFEDEKDGSGLSASGPGSEHLGTSEQMHHRLRRQAWGAVVAGAAGQAYGHGAVSVFAPGWESALRSPGARQMQVLIEFLRGRPWWTLREPLGGEGVKFVMDGSKGPVSRIPGKTDVQAAIGDEGRSAYLFVPTARKLRLDLSRMAGPISARWIDPVSGQTRAAGDGPLPAGGVGEFISTGKNEGGAEDFVLALETAPRASLRSLDFRGNCRDKPVPAGLVGRTSMLAGEVIEVEGYGHQFGYHCTEDQGRFVYTQLDRDFDVSVQLVDNRNEFGTESQAGIMARKGLDPADEYVSIEATADQSRYFADVFLFAVRTGRGKWLGSSGNDPEAEAFKYVADTSSRLQRKYPNVWLRLRRLGDSYTGYRSADGAHWTPLGNWTVSLGERPYVGFFLSPTPERGFSGKGTARFANVRGLPQVHHEGQTP